MGVEERCRVLDELLAPLVFNIAAREALSFTPQPNGMIVKSSPEKANYTPQPV